MDTIRRILLPGQGRTLEATLSAYQVGRADFTSLFETEVSLLDLDRALVRAQVDTRLHEAEMETLVGEGLPW